MKSFIGFLTFVICWQLNLVTAQTLTFSTSITNNSACATDIPSCACNGKMRNLTLIYHGTSGKTINYYKNKDLKANNLLGTFNNVQNGDVLVADASANGGQFEAETYFWVVGSPNNSYISIHTSCSQVIIGQTFGPYMVIGYTDGAGSECSMTPCNGSIDLSVFGGAAPYTYIWSNGATTQDLFNLCAGSYSVTAKDKNNVTKSQSFNVSQVAPDISASATTTMNSICNGACTAECFESATNPDIVNAKSTFTINQGAGTVTIRTTLSRTFVDNTYGTNTVGWSGSHSFSNLTGSDNLQLGLLDGNGVKKLDFKIDYITASNTFPSGYGTLGVTGGDGKLDMGNASDFVSVKTSLSENFNTYGYVLTSNSPATNSNYAPNPSYPNWIFDVWYEVTVKLSAFGPAGFGKPVFESVHASPSKTGNNSEPVEDMGCCEYNCDGSIDLTVSGAHGPFTFQWSNGATTEDLTGVCDGNYFVTITDAGGCTLIDTFTVLQVPSGIASSITSTPDESCGPPCVGMTQCFESPTIPDIVNAQSVWTIDQNAGTVTIKTTLAKTFVDNTYGTNVIGWPGSHSFGNLTGSDNLEIALYDANGAKKMQFKMDYLSSSSGAPSGYKSLGVTGGDGNITTGSASDVLSVTTSLAENFNTYGYVLTTNSPATDNNYTPNPTYPNWIFDVWYSVTVKLSAFGAAGFGVPHFVSVHASPSKTGHNTEVVDSIPCSDELCSSNCTGTIDLTVTAGNGPFSYLWSNGHTTEDLLNVCDGTYYVTITDANGCHTIDTAVVDQVPTEITVSAEATPNSLCSLPCVVDSNKLCFESPTVPNVVNGFATWSINQGAGTITIRTTLAKTFVDNTYGNNVIGWGNQSHSFSNLTGSDNLELGLYDKNGVLKLDFKIDYITSSNSFPSGYGTLGVTGGDGKMNTGNSSDVLSSKTSLSENFNTYGYVLTSNSPATDTNYTPNPSYPNWIFDVWYEVTVKTSAFGAAGFGFPKIESVHASPSKTGNNSEPVDSVHCIPPCVQICNGSINLTVSSGTAPFTYHWSNGATSEDIDSLCEGVYTVTITDAGGCTVTVTDTVPSGPCNDNDACTVDSCINGVCVYTPITCSDSNLCTIDSCVNGVCVFVPIVCNDFNACTMDSCVNGICVYTPVVCNDSNACTVDSCVNGVCVYTPRVCNDFNPCTRDSCVNGVCIYTPFVCNDQNACTNDYCLNGTCLYVPKSCTDSNLCTIDECINGECFHTPVACNDNNPCTIDTCMGSGCIFIPIDCNDNNPCTIDLCLGTLGCVNLPSGLTANVSGTNPTYCDSCNGTATAVPVGGAAPYHYIWSTGDTTPSIGGAPIPAFMGTKKCINAGGPQYIASTGDTFLIDQNNSGGATFGNAAAIAGTTDDVLYQTERNTGNNNVGATLTYNIPVVNGQYDISLYFAELFFGVSNFPSGSSYPYAGLRKFDVSIEGVLVLDDYDINGDVGPATAAIKTFTTTVADGAVTIVFTNVVNRGKVNGICVKPHPVLGAGGGLCAGPYSVTITDANGCTTSGSVTLGSENCNDGNACTIDACIEGVCVYTPVVCNDNNTCTTDSCDPILGCIFTPIVCDDGDPCTDDICYPGLGCVYTPKVCNDSNACTIDSCVNGTCVYTPIVCNDFDACTIDSCVGGECVYIPIVCNDSIACTLDSCINGVCFYIPIVCNDNDLCTVDSCADGTCVYTPIVCNDFDACTIDSCVGGECVYIPIVCNDSIACTLDSCINGVCFFIPIVCNDNDLCTVDSCADGTCVYTPIVCNDFDACTVDSCVNGVCFYTPIICNDSNACTLDSCVNGVCVYTPVNIDVTLDHTDVGCDCQNPNQLCLLNFAGLPHGTIVTEQYAAFGIHITGIANPNGANAAVVFNTASVGTPDPDLQVNIGNLLIIPANTTDTSPADGLVDVPNDNSTGGTLTITFDTPRNIESFKFVDKEDEVAFAVAYDLFNIPIGFGTILPLGDASVQTVPMNVNGVSKLVFTYANSGGITDIMFNDCDSNCCNGTAVATGIGGTAPYSYQWSTGASTSNIDSLCPGTYFVTVTDFNGCSKDTLVVIGQDSCNNPCDSIVCFDENPCTVDSCYNGQCIFTPIVCDDHNACTVDSCVNGVCIYTPVVCNDFNACTVDSCVNGVCVYTPVVCNDFNACTVDSCVNGVCVYTPVVCNDFNACTVDSCVNGVCVYTPVVCNDFNACTVDSCVNGVCIYTQKDCNDNIDCTIDVCDPVLGCLNIPTGFDIEATGVNPTRCDSCNGSATVNAIGGTPPFQYLWSTGDTTQSIGGGALALNGTRKCINTGSGTQFIASTGDTFLVDQDYSGGAPFSSGVAIANTTDDALYQSERNTGSNNVGVSMTYNIPVSNGQYDVSLYFAELYFGVSNFPSGSSFPYAGLRQFDVSIEGVLVLNDYDINGDVGPATAVTKTFTTTVTDGFVTIVFTNVINRGKVDGICVKPHPVAGGGGGLCSGTYTVTVTEANGCIATDTVVLGSNSCNDGNPCTTDSCINGVCIYTPVVCNDFNACTVDSCVNGVCTYTPVVCNDFNACTVDSCVNGVCIYTPVVCNDFNACTVDSCVNGVCTYTPVVCNDFNACTVDSCVNGVCIYTPVVCNDLNACTVDSCVNGVCVYTPVVCNDFNACTIDSCVNGECVYTPVICNDFNVCTNDSCVDGVCVYTPVDISVNLQQTNVSCACQNPDQLCILNFAGLPHGTIVTEQYAAFGIHISGMANPTGSNAAVVFNTASVGTPDPDLQVNIGNLLIIPANVTDASPADGLVDVPNDNSTGGALTILFDIPRNIESFKFVDKEDEVAFAVAYDILNIPIGFGTILPLGDASVQTVPMNVNGVSKLVFTYANSGGITDIIFSDCDSSCCDGTATASGTGGTAPYTFHWSNGDNTSTTDSLCPGTYFVTVTDFNGCSTDTMVTIGKDSCGGPCNGVVCNDFDVCTEDICVDGQCLYIPIAGCNLIPCTADSQCNDNNACTIDTCIDGYCAFIPKVCNDNNACTIDSCVNGVCIFTPVVCNDFNPCTNDGCINGVCTYTPIVCNDFNSCTNDACVNGVCVYTPIVCNDFNACTNDACVNGVCVYTPVVCNDQNICTTDSCVNGVCVYTPVPNCNPCPNAVTSLTLVRPGLGGDIGPLTNGSVINLDTLCKFNIRANACTDIVKSVRFFLNGGVFRTESAPPYAFNGDNNGNYNAWMPAPGSYTLVATPYTGTGASGTPGTSLTINFTILAGTGACICDDNDACTMDSLVNGQCTHTPKDCNDNNPCTLDGCSNGVCSNVPIPNCGNPCDTMVCNDNNPCTYDGCSNGVCVFTPIVCNDNNPCTNDACVNGSCIYTPKVCNDNNICTADGCVNGACVFTPIPGCGLSTCIPADCNDGDPCTIDQCVQTSSVESHCEHTPVPPKYFSDWIMICPGDSVFLQGAWQTEEGIYYDTIPSAIGCDSILIRDIMFDSTLCNIQNPCDTMACNDFNPCTTDSCADGVCIFTPVVCDDSNPCTIDICVGGVCQFIPDSVHVVLTKEDISCACIPDSNQLCRLNFAGLPHGTVLNNQYAAYGVHFAAVSNGVNTNTLLVYNSNLSNTRDPDLEVGIGNLAIIAENLIDVNPPDGIIDTPDDNHIGGLQIYTFDQDRTILSFTIVDVDHLDGNPHAIAYNAANVPILDVPIPILGDHTVQVVPMNISGARKLIISSSNSIGVTEILFDCAQPCCDGGVQSFVTGGLLPYTYSWSTGAVTENIDSLCPGLYCVTVTDAKGCSDVQCISVEEAACEQPCNAFNCNDNDNCTTDICDPTLGCIHIPNGGQPPYLRVVNYGTSWRKLKLGNNPTNLYSPTVDVTDGGNNNMLCVTLRDPNVSVDWSKIKINAFGGSAIIGNYLPVGGIGASWTQVCIPISAFTATPGNISLIEVPASNGHGAFEIHMQRVEFTGGPNPYLWFGYPKTDNINDGQSGSSSALYAELVPGVPCGDNRAASKRSEPETSAVTDQQNEMFIKAYPNPFSDQVTIEFTLPETERINLEILSVQGKKVAVLFDGVADANTDYKHVFQSGTLSNGMYFYRMVTESGEIHIGKLSLVR